MQEKNYAVIGLGRFGSSVATTLYREGNEVLAIDIYESPIEELVNQVSHTVIADSTDEETLKAIGIRSFDTVIVAIGDDIQASILTVLVLKELGINYVVAKALNRRHAQVLYKIGADMVVFPERDMGERVAHHLMSPNVLNFLKLDHDYSIEEVKVPRCMVDLNLREIDLRVKYNLNVIAIRTGEEIDISPNPAKVLGAEDVLVVVGANQDLDKFTDLA
ncbi:trk system potassium uptake protein TrkA [Thermoactinomyces sp. DSM 45891]|uniref:potassium channel family protein n=1 Tax=Thermoactinomyces sp. DSM 45891 TaxID=1761907 RepID=UPI0009223DB4|nr:TrkA family potassium uptake protein [Thermoactinomyces sp. DSM 45891]SFX54793.1 trk system potassium uptake protein TrkA [Thermoactinomyces sp. DSM 45891]